MLKDTHSGLMAVVALAASVLGAGADGAAVDVKGYDGCEFVLSAGVGGITFDGTNYIEVIMEESADGTAWTLVDDQYVLGINDVAAGVVKTFDAEHATAAVYRFGYVGYQPHVRLRLNFAGTHGTGTPMAAVAVMRGMDNPQEDQA